MTYENMKRLHKAYTDCGADKPRLDIEQWYPEFKVKVLTPAQKATATKAKNKADKAKADKAEAEAEAKAAKELKDEK